MKITELEFNVLIQSGSWTKGQQIELKTHNIFNNYDVMLSVAMWVAGKALSDNFLEWCFGRLHSNTNYEVMVGPWPPVEDYDASKKCSIFDLYVKPNEKLLRKMISEVDVASAKKWLKENR